MILFVGIVEFILIVELGIVNMVFIGLMDDVGVFGVAFVFAALALKKLFKFFIDDFVDEVVVGIVVGDFCGFGVDIDVLEVVVFVLVCV